jgi:3-oxosteroid 1-dehydrogenase
VTRKDGDVVAAPVTERAADRDGWGEEWDRVADVVVVGSGVAAQGAAFAAASAGASVIMLEKASFTGGTTGKSGGVLWIPNNPLMRAEGIEDGRSDALQYMARVAYPTLYSVEDETLGLPPEKFRLLEVFYDTGSMVVVEALTGAGALTAELVEYPDYDADLPEDAAPRGRTLQPRFPAGWRRGVDPTGGQLLIDQMQRTSEGLGIEVLLDHRAVHLVRNDDLEVIGLEVQVGKRIELFGARQAVIFGSGGFLHNRALTFEYLRGPVLGGGATEACTGDFVAIGIEVGAQLGNMSHAWWDQLVVEQAVRVPETSKDVYEPFGDSMLIVDRYGRRVVNEKIPYNERSQVHFDWDPVRRVQEPVAVHDLGRRRRQQHRRDPVPLPGATTRGDLRLRHLGSDVRRTGFRSRRPANEAGASHRRVHPRPFLRRGAHRDGQAVQRHGP